MVGVRRPESARSIYSSTQRTFSDRAEEPGELKTIGMIVMEAELATRIRRNVRNDEGVECREEM